MKFVIAGLGSIGRRHLRNLVSLGEKEILLYRTHLGTMPEEDLDGYKTVNDFQQALDTKPDAVIVSNPTAMHLDIAIPSAEGGVHMLLEKPVSHSLERVDELATYEKLKNLQILVGFQFRFHPTLIRMKELLSEGAIGTPVSCRAHWGEYLPNWHPWEDFRNSYAAKPELGGGVVLTLSHPFDYLRWIMGEVDSLWAFTSDSKELSIGSESTAEVGLQFSGGATGSVHLDYIQQPGSHTLDIIGSRGSLRWDNATGELKLFQAGNKEWTSFFPPAGFVRNDLFIAEMEAFLAMLRGDVPSPCTLSDGISALEIALAVLQSAKEKRIISIRR
jgi:predicted dehydrogenase